MSYEQEWREVFKTVYVSYNITNGMVDLYDYDSKTVRMAWSVDYSPLEFLQGFKVSIEQLPVIDVKHLNESDIDIFIGSHVAPREVLYDLGRILHTIATSSGIKPKLDYDMINEYIRKISTNLNSIPVRTDWKDWFIDNDVNISKGRVEKITVDCSTTATEYKL